ncbi:MAG: hypothetical protein QOJ64_648 [Acidobacteriota bacterium]|jgi:hypothetical protein|nr:hypothetical protein [Acidobacteriota bacterium]
MVQFLKKSSWESLDEIQIVRLFGDCELVDSAELCGKTVSKTGCEHSY